MHRPTTTFLMAAAVVATAACAPLSNRSVAGGGPGWENAVEEADLAITLAVRNDNWANMSIYVERDGMLARIGSINAMADASFDLTPAGLQHGGVLNIIARASTSQVSYRTQRLTVRPGQQVRLRLADRIHQSTVVVR
jgi:hypothetical protein